MSNVDPPVSWEEQQYLDMKHERDALRDERDRLARRAKDLEGRFKLVGKYLANGRTQQAHDLVKDTVLAVDMTQAALTPAGQRWTRSKPTEPGWYWWRIAPGHYAVIERYDKDADGGLVMYGKNGQGELIKHPIVSGEFQGPLTPNEATE